jgi:tRNA-binding protein
MVSTRASSPFAVAEILEVEEFPEARFPAYKLKIDFGPGIGVKRSSARIVDLYAKDELVGSKIIAVVNFPLKKIGPLESEVLTTGFYRPDGKVVLARPDKDVPNGAKLACSKFPLPVPSPTRTTTSSPFRANFRVPSKMSSTTSCSHTS